MEKIKKNYLGQGIQERTKKNLRKTAFKNLPYKNFTFPILEYFDLLWNMKELWP